MLKDAIKGSTCSNIYGCEPSNILINAILITRNETRCCHFLDYAFQLAPYATSWRQDSIFHGLCYASLNGGSNTLILSQSDKYVWVFSGDIKAIQF